MAAKKLTPEQLQEKKLRAGLITAVNHVKMAWSMHQIKSYKDMLSFSGESSSNIPEDLLNRTITYQDVKDYIEHITSLVETEIKQLYAPPPIIEPKVEWKIPPYIDTDHLLAAHAISLLEKEHDKDYGLHKSPKEKAFLFWFQKKATKELWDAFTVLHKRAELLIAGTGTGKTYIAGALLRRLLDIKFHEGKTFTPWPYVYVTKASVVEQTKRVFENCFGIDTENEVLVINIDQLRSQFGQRFVREECKIEWGEEHFIWYWRKNIFPIAIFWDECQSLKNEDSQQSQIAQAYNDIETDNTIQCFISATPFTRVAEAKCFCVATHIPYRFGISEAPLSNNHWPSFARDVASPADPLEHSPAAINKLMDLMDAYVVRVKGVKTQFHALNKVQMIHFQSREEREFYDKAWERYLEQKAKYETDETLSAAQSRFQILVEMLKFRQAAELCRAPYIAKAMWESVEKHKQAAVAALNFKGTIIKITQILVYDYNVPREKISLIWGGGQTQLSAKQKKKKKVQEKFSKLMEEEGIDLSDLNLDEVEDKILEELDPTLKLGNQSRQQRQDEIDKFQRGESLYCLYSFRAGGVGLSLHHTDELTKEKVRHKESGYAYEEDIPKIPTRQRVNFVAPTWSAMELVQGLGRCPRLTSLSDTPQLLIFYAGTIEEKVARIVSMKLRCLSKVVRQKESWEDVIVGHYTDEEVERRHLTEPKKEETVEPTNGNGNGDDSSEGTYIEDEESEDDEDED